MNLEKAKRYVSFIYWIPASIIIFARVGVPEYFFLALPLPYYALVYYLMQKTPKEERSQVEYARVALVTISHLVLYFMMFYR